MFATSLAQRWISGAPIGGIRRSDLSPGDWVVVTTRNSRYSILALADGLYHVSGGWFDREGQSPTTVAIAGCTLGGRAIHTGIVAGRGFHLEFGNHVVTTRIRDVRIIRASESYVLN